MERLLITGAAGGVGAMIRNRLDHLAQHIRLSDIEAFESESVAAEVVQCDLGDAGDVMGLVEGCDGIVHLGGVSLEDRFDKIRRANIDGVYNLYEAARRHGVKRILFASSNHVVGYHPQTERLDATAPLRPDGLYGVSKCFGEAMANLYHDKFGIETALVRIGSCFAEPSDHRMLSTWLSIDDLVALVECVFRVPRLGCPVIYGASNNSATWWDNAGVGYLGWTPRSRSDDYRQKVALSAQRPLPDDPAAVYQGGKFTTDPIHE
ncbi:MAG: NAD-dependent dehydratase [Rhizobiaceae bacterium MnEN-MB40S]|nr:MAG: NAD-dependent dehydratase [Rhizobiaceae bacterium MnEN-MB40S]